MTNPRSSISEVSSFPRNNNNYTTGSEAMMLLQRVLICGVLQCPEHKLEMDYAPVLPDGLDQLPLRKVLIEVLFKTVNRAELCNRA